MAEQKNIMSYETVALDDEQSALVILDQTKLPYEVEVLHLTEQKDIWDAIYLLKVRGAPAIGVAGGFGVYLAAKRIQADNYDEFYAQFKKAKEYLDSSRPTAVNLSWALNRMEKVVTDNKDKSIPEIKELLHKECVAIKDEDVWMCRQIGEYGLSLIKDGDGILTHCNAGQLATSKYGTALAPIHLGRERGMNFRVFTDETRPLLQGARLSSFELQADGVDTTVICDNMASQVMKNGWVNAVFVGCDRVAANGELVLTDGVDTGVQDIKLRLFTRLGDLFYDREFGSLIHDWILEDSTAGNRAAFESEIVMRIEEDPRVVVRSVRCAVTAWDETSITALASWRFLDEDTPLNLVLQINKLTMELVIEDADPRTDSFVQAVVVS